MTHFRKSLLIFLAASCLASGQQYAEKNGWSFVNFNVASLPWDVYRESYIGIPPTRDVVSEPFDVLFYDQVFLEQSKTGNCFGMALMSLMMQKKGGHLGFCLPVSQYSGDIGSPAMGPSEPLLQRAITIMHGHQVNLPTVQYILDVFAKHKNRDGGYAYTTFQNVKAQNDLAVVMLYKTISPGGGGHALIAYDAVDMGGGNKRIFVYDPNRSWADTTKRTWYTNGTNYIQINNSSWTFQMDSGEVWTGDPGSGGNIWIMPVSVTGPHTRNPASLGVSIIGRILNEIVLVGDSAQVEQITDSRGKRLFRPGTRELDSDPSTGLLNMVPWHPSDQAAPGSPFPFVLFGLSDTPGALTIELSAPDSGYALTMNGARGRIAINATGGRGTDSITITQPGSAEPTVEIANVRGASAYQVEFTHRDIARREVRQLKASNLQVVQGGHVSLSAAASHDSLAIGGADDTLRYDLELRLVTPQGVQAVTRQSVQQEPGISQSVRPRNWSRLSPDEMLETTTPARIPPVVHQRTVQYPR